MLVMINANLTKIETYYDDTKTIVLERYYIDENFLRQSLYEAFYKDGKPYIKGTYKNGVCDGLFEWFDENGKLKGRCTFKNDKRDGLFESFDENGKLKGRCTFKNDKRDGLFEKTGIM